MSAQTSLALLRIELKLDLLLASAAARDPALAALLASGDALATYNGDICPTCTQPVKIVSDLNTEEYIRSCGCRPPLPIVAGISALTEPIVEKKPPQPLADTPDEPEEPAPNAQVPTPRRS